VGYELRVIGTVPSMEELRRYADILERRLPTPAIVPRVRVTVVSERALLLEVDREAAARPEVERYLRGVFQRPPTLEFRILAKPRPDEPDAWKTARTRLRDAGPQTQPGDEVGWFKIDDPPSFFSVASPDEVVKDYALLNQRYVVEKRGDDYYVLAELNAEQGLLRDAEPAWCLKRVQLEHDATKRKCITLTLDEAGGEMMAKLTGRNIERSLGILVDGLAISAPNITGRVREHAQIAGTFSDQKVQRLFEQLELASQPFHLEFGGLRSPP